MPSYHVCTVVLTHVCVHVLDAENPEEARNRVERAARVQAAALGDRAYDEDNTTVKVLHVEKV